MGPRSRSRSPSPQRSYSRSPDRRARRRHSRSVSRCRNPPSPPPLPPTKHDSRYSNGSRRRSLSRSPPPSPSRFSRRQFSSRRQDSRSRMRSRSRSPYRTQHNREGISPCRCLGVFGLSVNTSQKKIRDQFSKFGPIERIQVVTDARTGHSRGFCFIYYERLEDAGRARDHCCGLEIDGRRIRVAYSMTQRAHTPTPGRYKGEASEHVRWRKQREPRHRIPPSPPRNGSNRGRYERDRSRSRSPRRYR